MSVAAALGLGLLIGAVLGALGGGGAVLTVPFLVYVLGQSVHDATTSSLVIVGLTAAVGTLGHARARHVRWRTGLLVGLAGLASAYAGTALNRQIDERLLLIGFAAVMSTAAVAMLVRADRAVCPPEAEPSWPAAAQQESPDNATDEMPRSARPGAPSTSLVPTQVEVRAPHAPLVRSRPPV